MFGVEMAKNLMKKAKKAAKSVKKEAKSQASEVKQAVKEVKSSAKSHIESLAKSRRDAAIVWGMIQNGNHSTEQIKKMCEEKGFSQLLSEIS